MTKTAQQEKETNRIMELIKGDFHDEMANLSNFGVSQKSIAMLVNMHLCLTEELEITKNQVSALTKENEELKAYKLQTREKLRCAEEVVSENAELNSRLSALKAEHEKLQNFSKTENEIMAARVKSLDKAHALFSTIKLAAGKSSSNVLGLHNIEGGCAMLSASFVKKCINWVDDEYSSAPPTQAEGEE